MKKNIQPGEDRLVDNAKGIRLLRPAPGLAEANKAARAAKAKAKKEAENGRKSR